MDGVMLLRALIALVFVVGLLLLFAAGLRRWGGKLGLMGVPQVAQGKKIQLLEASMLDSRHRLFRVRVDNREHLILLGGATPVVVESRDAKDGT